MFKDNIGGADFADMQLMSKHHKEIRFLLCMIGIISKNSWVVSLKDRKVITIVNAFKVVLNNSKRNPN